jgi:hypothetical protein
MGFLATWTPTFFLCVSLLGAIVFLALGGGGVLRLWAREPVGIAVPAFACLLVFGAPQMADMFAGMRHGFAGRLGEADLGVAVFLLAVQGWFWMRAGLNSRGYPGGRTGWRDADIPSVLSWQEIAAPRLTLVPATLIAISPIFQALDGNIPWVSVPWFGAGSAVLAAAVVWSWAWRRRSRLLQLRAGGGANGPAAPVAIILVGWRVTRLFRAAPGGPRYAVALLVIAVLYMVLAQVAPDLISDYLHAPGAALLGLASLVAVAAVWLAILRDLADFVLAWMRHRFGANGPASLAAGDLIGLAAIIALPFGVSSLAESTGLYDVEPVHVAAQSDGENPIVAGRPDVQSAAAKFLTCHASESGNDVPAIIIASEGGASRSAAWTLSVMRMLDARTGGAVGAHLFAVIGVSGGSLGAVTYVMAQATQFPQAATAAPTAVAQVAFWSKPGPAHGMVELARADLLSSTVARMFDDDTFFGVPTRGQALQHAFEHHWAWDRGFDMPGLAQSGLLGLRQGRDCLPHLILNGTDVETGNRLLTSTIRFGLPDTLQGDGSPINQPFSAAIDVLYNLNTDIPAAAAVLNSARFPIISPPGMLRTGKGSPSGDGDRLVIDGGVFENFGARVAWELADAIAAANPRIKPIVLLISNEVDLAAVPKPGNAGQNPEGRCVEDSTAELNKYALATARADRTRTGVAVPELLTSVFGLYNIRAGHARGEIEVLRRQNCTASPPTLYQFDLPRPVVEERQAAPMNWTLDVNTCQFLLGAARRASFNVAQVLQLRQRLLGSGAGAGPSDMANEDSSLCQGDAELVKPWPG